MTDTRTAARGQDKGKAQGRDRGRSLRSARSALVSSPEAREQARREQEDMVQEFLRRRGATVCPSGHAPGSHHSRTFGSDI